MWILFFVFSVCLFFFLAGGGGDGLIIVQKKGNFMYYLKKLLSTRHCNTLHCFIIVIFVQWVLVQLLNFRLSLRKRRWQKWKALAAQVISVTNFNLHIQETCFHQPDCFKYLLLSKIKFEVPTISCGSSFFSSDLWPACFVLGP